MEWSQLLFIVLGNAGIWIPLLLWIKGGQEEARKECLELILSGQAETRAHIREIEQEMKYFHDRLCVIASKLSHGVPAE